MVTMITIVVFQSKMHPLTPGVQFPQTRDTQLHNLWNIALEL